MLGVRAIINDFNRLVIFIERVAGFCTNLNAYDFPYSICIFQIVYLLVF